MVKVLFHNMDIELDGVIGDREDDDNDMYLVRSTVKGGFNPFFVGVYAQDIDSAVETIYTDSEWAMLSKVTLSEVAKDKAEQDFCHEDLEFSDLSKSKQQKLIDQAVDYLLENGYEVAEDGSVHESEQIEVYAPGTFDLIEA